MSQQYLLPCSCGASTPVTKVQAGQTIACRCGRELEVPTLHGIGQLEPVEPDEPVRRRQARWDRRRGLILLGLVIAAAGGLWAGYLELTRPRLGDIQDMPPATTWALWQELRLGADRFPTPEARFFSEQLQQNRNWMLVAVIVAGAGVLVMAGAYALLRPSYVSDPGGGHEAGPSSPP